MHCGYYKEEVGNRQRFFSRRLGLLYYDLGLEEDSSPWAFFVLCAYACPPALQTLYNVVQCTHNVLFCLLFIRLLRSVHLLHWTGSAGIRSVVCSYPLDEQTVFLRRG